MLFTLQKIPLKKGACYQEDMTNGYVFPDEYLELEAHDRTNIDLPAVQRAFAKAVLALGMLTIYRVLLILK